MNDFQQTVDGSYHEPFHQWQYGGFTKRNGEWWFIAAALDPEMAKVMVRNYYEDMEQHPQNKMVMAELDEIRVVRRKVTYGLWEEVPPSNSPKEGDNHEF